MKYERENSKYEQYHDTCYQQARLRLSIYTSKPYEKHCRKCRHSMYSKP